jgi:hypothetical protein
MHTDEVLQMALQSQQKPLSPAKKRRFIEDGRTQPEGRLSVLRVLLGVGLLAAASFLISGKLR